MAQVAGRTHRRNDEADLLIPREAQLDVAVNSDGNAPSFHPVELSKDRSELPDRQFLNAADRLMLVAHRGLESLGHPGFQCQTHAWLDGRIDILAFRQALNHLAKRYPVVTSRLALSEGRNGPSWCFDASREIEFAEHRLTGSGMRDPLDWAESVFETPLDLDRASPISFHVLHLPDGRDVVVLRFTHVLMDGKSPELVLKEIDRLSTDPSIDVHSIGMVDEMRAHLMRFDRKRRRLAAARVVRSRIHLPKRALRLSRPDAPKWVLGPYRARVRTLDASQTDRLTARVKKHCGFPNLCAATLASAFRGVVRHAPQRVKPNAILQTDVPINLRPPGTFHPIFCNFMSFVGVRIRAHQLDDRDAATHEITSQMRHQLRKGMDVGNLQMMHFMSRFDRTLRFHIKKSMQWAPITVGFGFQGPTVTGLERFCGLPVSQLYSLNSALHPPGITFQVNQFRGCTNLVLTYVGGAVSNKVAEAFLDTVVEDLLA